MAQDYYKTLGLRKGASDAQIKSAYRKLARKYHPDVNPGDQNAERRFKEISEAYNVLGDPKKKKNYDQFGTAEPNPFSGGGGGFGFSGFDFDKAGGKSNFSDLFDELFNRKSRKKKAQARPRKGEDLQYVINLSFMDAIKGITTEVSLSRKEACHSCAGKGSIRTGSTQTCRVCGGTGKKTIQSGALRFENDCHACNGAGVTTGSPCSTCHGSGTVNTRDKITVRIPPGVDNGSRVRVAGKGNAGVRGGAAGDLYIITNVEPHDLFTRKGNNIYLTVPVTVSEAALGSKIEVPTLDGKSVIRIPPSTQSGQKLRLQGRGAQALRGGGKGDQFIEVKIVLPEIIDEGSKELYRQLQAKANWDPRKKLFDKM
jgi:molecular chaperone DnaJ